jgi:uncharacterized protein YoxC
MDCDRPADALRETNMPSNEMILTIMVSVLAVGVLIQLIILFVMFLAISKGMKLAAEYASEMKEKVVPVLEHSKVLLRNTNELVTRLEPKLEAAATDLAEAAKIANAEVKKIQESADEITERVRRQVARVDSMATDTLNAAERVGFLLNQAVTIPIRQVSGIMAAGKAIFETLRTPAPRTR